MALIMDKLTAALQAQSSTVYYFASTEAPLLRQAAQMCIASLTENQQQEYTRIDGPTPNIGDVIAAAGTISFFGAPRVVELREISLSTMKDKDVAELEELLGQLENAVLVITSLLKDKKAGTTQKAKKIMAAAQKYGFAAELAKPTARENIAFLHAAAKKQGSSFAHGAAEALLERVGENRVLLLNEVQKLAAISGYGEIAKETVAQYSAYNIEADVFELARLITSGNKAGAQHKLQQLFALKHEPIAIAAALAGTFVDMYRVRCGLRQHKTVQQIFTELGYKGNSYRLQKAKENVAHYSDEQLEDCIVFLLELDRALKSSALSDKTVLVQSAVAQLMQTRSR